MSTKKIAPSLLSANFMNLEKDLAQLTAAKIDLLHLDVMDGHFVPNLTMGPTLCQSLRTMFPDTYLDVHLMVQNPLQFIDPFASAGCNLFTGHIEANVDPIELADTIHAAGMDAGLAINPPTDVEKILPYLDKFDLLLVMSVNPGFSGQSFIPEVLHKVEIISQRITSNQRLQMDGGISSATVESCTAAGCDTLVAASAIFKSEDYAAAIAGLRGS